MHDKWRRIELGEAATWLSGGTPKKSREDYWGGEIPWISGKTLVSGPVGTSERRLTELGAREGSRIAPQGATLLLVRGMSLLQEVRVGRASRPVAFNQDVKALVPNEEFDETFFTYAIEALRPQLLRLVHQASHGTGVLETGAVKSTTIPVPALSEQRRIAGVLGALDDLADADGRLSLAMDDLFLSFSGTASRNVDARRSLGEICEVAKGVSYKGAFLEPQGLPMINLANFGRDGRTREDGTKFYTGPVKESKKLTRGDLVVSNTDLTQTRDILGRPMIVPYEAATSTHHTFQLRVAGGEAQRMWLYAALRSEPVRRSLIAQATGTTVAALPRDSLELLLVPWPGTEAIEKWWNLTKSLFLGQWELQAEASRLRAVRDELLPLLMSGRVRVREVRV